MRGTMRTRLSTSLGLVAAAIVAAAAAPTGEIIIPGPDGTVIIPPSSIQRPQDAGIRAHTNTRLFFPDGVRGAHKHPEGRFETPASLACLYRLVPQTTGCNPTTATEIPTGGSKTIAIVDAYDDPNAAADLGVFSAQFGLPAVTQANFQIVYASGTQPQQDPHGLWELEETLDIEWARAMAPNANVILVEAPSSNLKDLYAAVQVAASLVAAAGGGEVSNSWGGAETPSETGRESLFTGSGVVFLASAGDAPGTNQPSVLQNVIAVGGTSIKRDANYNFVRQSAWNDTGGGSSPYVAIPSYQAPIAGMLGQARGVPDMAFDANPHSGVWIYDSVPYFGKIYDWLVIGGTSVAAPAMAGILNSAGGFADTSAAELTEIYGEFSGTRDWTDIKHGSCGAAGVYDSGLGWDFCTGVGVPRGYEGK